MQNTRCLSTYCTAPATHWHGGGPYCHASAIAAMSEEGSRNEPVPGTPQGLAAFYTDRGLSPALRATGSVARTGGGP